MRLSLVAALVSLPLTAACPNSGAMKKPDNFPSADAFVAELVAKQTAARSFKAESRMDYRVNNDRIKTTVYVMGERGAKVRFNALNPDDTVGADLACDGINFAFVDFNKNCQLTGPCTADAIGTLLRVNLEPDDFLALAIGSAPLLADATAEVEWNSKNGTAVLKLLARDNQHNQELILDGKDANYDVLFATMRDAKGEIDWSLENKDFSALTAAQGAAFRVPGKTRFQQPKNEGDLKVRWQERELNLELTSDKFAMEPPAGLPECGAKPASTQGAAPAAAKRGP